MPHQAELPPNPYNPHMDAMMRGRPHPPPPHPHGSPPMHMLHPSEAARMAAFHRARAFGGPPHPGHRMPPHPHGPPMWHHADRPSAVPRHTRPPPVMTHSDSVTFRKRHVPPSAAEQAAKRVKREREVESAEETAATALLMASSAPQASPNLEPKQETGAPSSGGEAQEPTKKRKKHLDVLRRNQDAIVTSESNPCHVSPMSNASLGSHNDGHSDEAASIVTQSSRTTMMLLHESSSGSYDMREAAVESKKAENATDEATPPDQVEVPHFPSVLHDVLADSNSSTVLKWLPHGQAWKIVRWDALRREVLPRHFPDLCQVKGEDGNGGGSMDSFLWHVRAWGFEEVKVGPDVGAYHHMFFLRGVPKLCKRMTYSATAAIEQDSEKSPENSLPNTPKTQEVSDLILRVPSLRSDGEQDVKQKDAKDQQVPVGAAGQGMHERSPVRHGWPQTDMGMSYRADEGRYADARHMSTESPMRNAVAFPPPYSPRFPFRAHPGDVSPTVRSGRGGSRTTAGASRRSGESSSKSSFPVSQRGKGNRARVCRVPLMPSSDNVGSVARTHSTDSTHVSTPKSQSPGLDPESSSTQATAVTISHKKRLPLVRKSGNSTVDAPSEVQETP